MLETLGNTFRIPELRRRVLVTVVLLSLCQIGAFIPVPGVDTSVLANFFKRQEEGAGGTLLNFVNIFTGPSLQHFAIFSLGVMPYISASIIFQLLVEVVPSLKKVHEEGEAGRKKIHQWTRYATVVLCFFQGGMMVRALGGHHRHRPHLSRVVRRRHVSARRAPADRRHAAVDVDRRAD